MAGNVFTANHVLLSREHVLCIWVRNFAIPLNLKYFMFLHMWSLFPSQGFYMFLILFRHNMVSLMFHLKMAANFKRKCRWIVCIKMVEYKLGILYTICILPQVHLFRLEICLLTHTSNNKRHISVLLYFNSGRINCNFLLLVLLCIM